MFIVSRFPAFSRSVLKMKEKQPWKRVEFLSADKDSQLVWKIRKIGVMDKINAISELIISSGQN